MFVRLTCLAIRKALSDRGSSILQPSLIHRQAVGTLFPIRLAHAATSSRLYITRFCYEQEVFRQHSASSNLVRTRSSDRHELPFRNSFTFASAGPMMFSLIEAINSSMLSYSYVFSTTDL